MKEYLKKTNPYLINFYSWHEFSKLSFQEASGKWMDNFNKIINLKHEKTKKENSKK